MQSFNFFSHISVPFLHCFILQDAASFKTIYLFYNSKSVENFPNNCFCTQIFMGIMIDGTSGSPLPQPPVSSAMNTRASSAGVLKTSEYGVLLTHCPPLLEKWIFLMLSLRLAVCNLWWCTFVILSELRLHIFVTVPCVKICLPIFASSPKQLQLSQYHPLSHILWDPHHPRSPAQNFGFQSHLSWGGVNAELSMYYRCDLISTK